MTAEKKIRLTIIQHNIVASLNANGPLSAVDVGGRIGARVLFPHHLRPLMDAGLITRWNASDLEPSVPRWNVTEKGKQYIIEWRARRAAKPSLRPDGGEEAHVDD